MRWLQAPRKILYLKDFSFHLNEKEKRRFRIAGEFLGTILLTALLSYIFLNNLTPFGVTTHYMLGEKNAPLSDPGPKDRVNTETINGTKIFHQTHDLIYFTTKMPFVFDSATVRVIFSNPNPDQSVSLGFQDQSTWHYDTTPIDVPYLNSLSDWNKIGTGPVLYQRTKAFASVDNFLVNPPTNDIIGTYHYDNTFGSYAQQIPNYTPSTTDTVIDTPLRGKQTIYVYLQHEPFIMTFAKQDLNWYEDPDPLSIKVYKDHDLVYQDTIDDDGITDSSQRTLAPQELEIKNPGPGLPEDGVYKVVIDASSDTIIKKITTNLHKIVFAGSLFLAGNKDVYHPVISSTSATTLFTDALLLSATTYHNAGLQTITVGSQSATINTIKQTYPITPREDLSTIVAPKNDLIFNAFQGYFAFTQDQFFKPVPYHLLPINESDDLDLVDYILTDYQPSKKVGDWQVAEKTFDLRSAYIKNGKLSWIISAPKLKTNQHEILIQSIEVTLRKNPLL